MMDESKNQNVVINIMRREYEDALEKRIRAAANLAARKAGKHAWERENENAISWTVPTEYNTEIAEEELKKATDHFRKVRNGYNYAIDTFLCSRQDLKV